MDNVKLALLTVFHPSDMFLLVKRRRSKVRPLPVLLLLTLFLAVRFAAIYITHFPLADVQPDKANLLLETAIMLVPILTWTLSIYAITAIMGGEMTFSELMTVNMYCLLPFIVFTIPISLLSNILSTSESALYTGLHTVCIIWICVLLFAAVKTMNNYSFSSAVGITALGIVGMLLIWCVVILLAILTLQFFCFLQSLWLEFSISTLK